MGNIYIYFVLLQGFALVKSQGFDAYANVSYGSDPQQVMDIYLPPGRDPSVSKVIVLIHGGGWGAGQKEDMNEIGYWFFQNFPRFGIVNLGYRLGSVDCPGYPKQIHDITTALKFITAKKDEYKINPIYGLVGASAGAHLALLYGYSVDKSEQVNVIANIVGPSDLTDPSYAKFDYSNILIQNLVGNYTVANNPQLYAAASPVTYITRKSPKTISFYGAIDNLVPVTQGQILEDKLDSVGVFNKYYLYPDEGHGFVKSTTIDHLLKKTLAFFRNYL